MFQSCFDCKHFELRNSIAVCKKSCFVPTSIFYSPPHLFVRACPSFETRSNRPAVVWKSFDAQFSSVLRTLVRYQNLLKDSKTES